MSYRPARGRLREGTSGVARSQAGFGSWGKGRRVGDWSDLWLDVIMRRTAISDRSVVTAAKCVYSTWQFNATPGERHGETLYRHRFASQPVHQLRAAGKRQELSKPVAAGRAVGVCEEAAARRRVGGGGDWEHAAVLRRGGCSGGADRGGGYEPVSGDQPVGKEDRFQRRPPTSAVSQQGAVAGGAHEK